jgi:hypothetical protein
MNRPSRAWNGTGEMTRGPARENPLEVERKRVWRLRAETTSSLALSIRELLSRGRTDSVLQSQPELSEVITSRG